MGIKQLQGTGQEILLLYLYNKATGRSDCTTSTSIHECDLYGDKDPWKIWNEYCRNGGDHSGTNSLLKKKRMKKNEEDIYVFTKLKKKSVKSSRFDRTVGEIGAWKGEDSGVKLYYEDKNNRGTITKVHGIRKRFRYESSCNSVHDGRWTMYEYSLDASMPIHAKFPDYVLCRIKKNDEPEKKRKLKDIQEKTEIMKENGSESNKAEHVHKKTKVVSFETQENKKLELICSSNNNNGIPAAMTTTTNANKVAAIDTELQHGGNRVVIDLSDDDHDNSTSEDAPVINNIGTTLVAEESNSMESPSENIDCTRLMIEAPGVNESLDPIYDVKDHSDWAIAFAEELMEGQPQLMQETEIEMLPNVYFHEDWLGSKIKQIGKDNSIV